MLISTFAFSTILRMRRLFFVAALAALLCELTHAASTFSPAKPPAIPLAVRSPYLSTWLDGKSGGVLPGSWPKFYNDRITGWQGFVRVDGVAYNWMGAAPGPPLVNQLAFEYTSTRSIFTFDVAGKLSMTVTFLSPVYPDDLVKQSLQFSYIDIKLKPSDGVAHNVQIYMDISGEIASGDDGKHILWNFGTEKNVLYHQIALVEPTVFSESHEQADWGTWFLATSVSDGLTYKSGVDTDIRPGWASSGRLDNGNNKNFRSINESWPVFAFSKDMGNLNRGDERELLFTLGLEQDKVINFKGSTAAPVGLDAAWKKYFTSGADSLAFFHNDWSVASKAATALDDRIRAESVAVAGEDYAAITMLAVRQAFGGLQVAQGYNKQYIFLKEISSNSDIQTVDVIFPAMPLFLYLNPSIVKLLLEPLIEYQETGAFNAPYAMHDMGKFPNALGRSVEDDELMPLEESGNMLIMALVYTQRSGETTWLANHWPKLQTWAEYLVGHALVPEDQLSTDDFSGKLANQTNLALKGIIGIRAAAEIAKLTGHPNEGRRFEDVAGVQLAQWQLLGINSGANLPHATLAYHHPDSHGLLYNLYADRLLGLKFVPDSVYKMQSDFYKTIQEEHGVRLDTRGNLTKSDWEMFAAAVAERDTRDMFISKLRRWIGASPTGHAMTDLFDVRTGAYPEGGPEFYARPVVGGAFALLALPK